MRICNHEEPFLCVYDKKEEVGSKNVHRGGECLWRVFMYVMGFQEVGSKQEEIEEEKKGR